MSRLINCATVTTALLGAAHAYAQEIDGGSRVALFGQIDAGVTYASNVGGTRSIQFADGVVPNLWGLTGQEDLGDGVISVFRLSSQFNVGSGTLLTPNTLFSREAWVGLRSARYGSLTMGNQYDFMVEALPGEHNEPAIGNGLYAFPSGPFGKIAYLGGKFIGLPGNPPIPGLGSMGWDRTKGASELNNSIKYMSPRIDGIRFGGMYSFGGVAGRFGSNGAQSFGLSYDNGTFGVSAAYLSMRPQAWSDATLRWWGAGAHYQFDRTMTLVGDVTSIHNSANNGNIIQGSLGATYLFAPDWSVSGEYTYMKGNAYLDNNHANQFTATLTYPFSKRTAVYAEVVYQLTNATAPQDPLNGGANITLMVPSSTPRQGVAHVGMRTMF